MKAFNGYKRCPDCGDILPICMFYKNKIRADGLQDQCIDCDSEHRRRYYEANKAKVNERNRKWYEKHREELKEYNRRGHARYNGYQDAVELFENPFPSWITVEYHHIDDHHVIPIPKVIHDRYKPNLTRDKHKAALKPIIEDLYQISYEVTK